MAKDRFKQLITGLHQATHAGGVRWQETAEEEVFRVGLGEGLVRIREGYDDREQSLFVSAHLLDKRGRTVDELFVHEDQNTTSCYMTSTEQRGHQL